MLGRQSQLSLWVNPQGLLVSPAVNVAYCIMRRFTCAAFILAPCKRGCKNLFGEKSSYTLIPWQLADYLISLLKKKIICQPQGFWFQSVFLFKLKTIVIYSSTWSFVFWRCHFGCEKPALKHSACSVTVKINTYAESKPILSPIIQTNDLMILWYYI